MCVFAAPNGVTKGVSSCVLVKSNKIINGSFSHLGGVKARKLYDQGIRSVEDLKNHQGLLNAGQKIGLKYLEVWTELHVAVWTRSGVRIRIRPKQSGPRIAFMYG